MKTLFIPSIQLKRFTSLLIKYTNKTIVERKPYIYCQRCYLELKIK